ncbi:glycosyltransferase family 2 protein [Yeosuana sp. AK3]
MNNPKFTITIPTKNRLSELKFTLQKLKYLIERKDVVCLICDDGSSDGTYEYIRFNFPKIKIFKNSISKGIHFTRNILLNNVSTPFIVSLDDDAHIITENVLELIENYFDENPKVGLLSFRAFWNKSNPRSIITNQKPEHVKSFGAVSFAMRTEVWRSIPNFPEWFVFYGEEDFAAFHLFKKGWQIHYLPQVLVHHRVNIRERKKNKDYQLRLRRSLRSGWYLYFLFYPWKIIPKRFVYTLYIQIKTKVLRGDMKAFLAIIQGLFDVVFNIKRLIKSSNRLTNQEFSKYKNLSDAKLYWIPENDIKI